MNKRKYPIVFICADAADKAIHEADKFYHLGKQKSGSPWEAAMYPLAHLVLRSDVYKSPLDIVEIEEIKYIVITHVFYPLDKHKDYSSGRATFKKNVGANEYMNTFLEKYINRYPLLDVFCKQHSHPHTGGDYLSQGDVTHSVFNAYDWFRKKGLNTMFSLVMTPMSKLEGWYFSCFGLKNDGRHIDLFVEIISRNHPYVKAAKVQPYYRTKAGQEWCDFMKRRLCENGFQVARNILRRGWRRYTITMPSEKYILCIPPFFPKQLIKIYWVTNDLKNPYYEIRLPNSSVWTETSNSYQAYDLVNLIHAIRKRN